MLPSTCLHGRALTRAPSTFALLAAAFLWTIEAQAQTQAVTAPALAGVKSWGYQLQSMDADTIARSPHDLVVIDGSRDGKRWQPFTPDDIARMKVKPDGTRRIMLCYFSIGEAETYRFYWQKHWSWMSWAGWRWIWQSFGDRVLPSWLAGENPEWRGNYAVRYWLPGWQRIIVDGDDSYLTRILAAGFDGVYLDKIDQFADMASENANARRDMIALVKRIAERARARVPGFLIVPQNGEELLRDVSYRAVIDGIGKEDLLYGDPKEKVRNAADLIARNSRDLGLLVAERKPVLAVEYLREPSVIATTRRELEAQRFIPLFADRALDNMRSGDLPANTREGER